MKRIIACALLLPAAAMAQDGSQISYDYFDVDYSRMDWDTGSDEVAGTGWGGRLSVGIREHVFVAGEFNHWAFGYMERSPDGRWTRTMQIPAGLVLTRFNDDLRISLKGHQVLYIERYFEPGLGVSFVSGQTSEYLSQLVNSYTETEK